jgi:hypothetical protein
VATTKLDFFQLIRNVNFGSPGLSVFWSVGGVLRETVTVQTAINGTPVDNLTGTDEVNPFQNDLNYLAQNYGPGPIYTFSVAWGFTVEPIDPRYYSRITLRAPNGGPVISEIEVGDSPSPITPFTLDSINLTVS